MADLQRQVNVKPTIASIGSPPQQTNVAAQAIREVGGAVRSFLVERKKSKLTEELRSLGDDVFAVTTGKEVQKTTDRINRLKQARDQGAISDTMVKIEAEALLKESIDTMPGFGTELRQHAARILGFDPTGSQIRALLDIPKDSGNVFEDRQRQQAEFIAGTLGVDVNDVLKVQAKALLSKEQADLVTQQATIGGAGRRDILNATIAEADGFVSDFMGDVVTEIKQGGISDPEALKAEINARILGQQQALRDRYLAAGLTPDSNEIARDMALVESQWESLIDMADSGSLGNILSNHSKALTHAMTIEGYNVMGDVALINSAAGQEGVKHYFLTLDKYGKQGQLDLLRATNPVLNRTVETIEDSTRLASEAYKRVMGVSPQFEGQNALSPDEQATIDVYSDRIYYDLAVNNNLSEEERLQVLSYAKNHGQKFKAVGAYMQKGARAAAGPEEIRFVKQTFQEEYPALINRVSSESASGGPLGKIAVEVENNELVLVDKRTGLKVGTNPNSFLATPVATPTAMNDIKRLNSFFKGLQNGWAGDLEVSVDSYLSDTASQINSTASQEEADRSNLESAIKAFENNPTIETFEAIREIDPDLASAVEQASKFTGDSNNNE